MSNHSMIRITKVDSSAWPLSFNVNEADIHTRSSAVFKNPPICVSELLYIGPRIEYVLHHEEEASQLQCLWAMTP